MTELTLKQETTSPTNQIAELCRIALWMLALILLPSIAMGFGMGIYFGVASSPTMPLDGASFEEWIALVPPMMTMAIGASILTLPLVKAATPAKRWRQAFSFYRLTGLEKGKLTRTIAIAVAFFAVLQLIDYIVPLPKEPFMEELQRGMTSATNIALTMVVMCLAAPVVEELVYRGWLFGRLEKTSIGSGYGALFITTLVFTVIHSQYETWVGYGAIVLMGLMFGLLRMHYRSISYSIVAHAVINSLSMALILLS